MNTLLGEFFLGIYIILTVLCKIVFGIPVLIILFFDFIFNNAKIINAMNKYSLTNYIKIIAYYINKKDNLIVLDNRINELLSKWKNLKK